MYVCVCAANTDSFDSLSHSQYRLKLPKLCYHPGWRLMRLGYRTCFHTLYDEKKKNKKNIYILYVCVYVSVLQTQIPLTLSLSLSHHPSLSSKRLMLYTLPMNIDGYVPFLINFLDTIVRGGKYVD